MKKKLDLTGQRYGRLVVVREVEPKDYSRRFLCRCDCGEEKTVYMTALRSGNAQSCGCLRDERTSQANSKDLTGKKFGRLTVLERTGTRNRKVVWLCRCDCGQMTEVVSDKLKSGEIQSCGCLRVEKGKEVQKYNEEHYFVGGVFTPLLASKLRKDNKTGHKGVTIVRRKKGLKYHASITVKGKTFHLGYYDRLEDAINARKRAEEKYHLPYLEQLENKEE